MNHSADIPTVSIDELPTEEYVLLDVREPDEWAAGHAPDAIHIPLGDLPSRAGELPELADDRPVHVICRTGGRSARAAAWLNAAGIVDAVNVAGGMKTWQAAGRPMVGEHGDAAPEVL
ncbi:rhodanese-like domain-containing protein [Saccharomonospora piscinae]|uniref:Sulfurtransferase n=1 Tax=Saccharomonospora piscinae TaxID=687388 RepID=A0A1V9A135_SACPI|nr:rhodanese-like domain-containing protein [Saccharomonospora piscinae]OQO90780.1 sulfurtransferase [Saccharomonospora piscinae]TLW93454.1 rhodanese-like domain-containing protein [Saccharomonospora piscinae]